MPKKLMYTGGPLDRAAEKRRDHGWVDALRRDPKVRVVPVWRSRNLVLGDAAPRAALMTGRAVPDLMENAAAEAFLGIWDDVPYFAIDLSDHEEDAAARLAGEAAVDGAGEGPGAAATGGFEDLRRVGRLLPDDEAAVLAYARGMMHWHRRQNFCTDCGAPTMAADAGHVHSCTNSDCGKSHFPRTDPAVIMLVTHRGGDGVERCLLGRSHRWEIPMFSTLAGFVEPGENLEEAVVREVYEEAGVRVSEVTYRGSQPWPFPQSLMLGFWARAEDTALALDADELREARWFSRGELDVFGEFYGEDDSNRPRLPRMDSISRRLIEDWRDLGD